MPISKTVPNIPGTYYSPVAFQLVINLLMLLKNRGAISENDRVELVNMVAAGLGLPNDIHVQAMKELLWGISGVKPS